jgi:hypothetical protein
LENDYLDALVMMVFAHVALLVVAGIFMLSSILMDRTTIYMNKRGGFNFRRLKFRHVAEGVKKDDKRNVVIAAAVAGYLQAEQERKI